MTNWHLRNSLYGQLLCYLFLSATVALLFYSVVFQGLQLRIESYTSHPSRVEAYATRHIRDLQSYITKEGLHRSNVEALALWNDKNWYTSINIADTNNSKVVYYDSFLRYHKAAEQRSASSTDAAISDSAAAQKTDQVVRISWDGLPYPCFTFPLHFADGDTTVTISGPYTDQYSKVFATVSTAVFLVVFLSSFFLLCYRRFSYIQELQREIDTICCGDLTHKLPVKGHDELTTLASYINHMSVSLQDQFLLEQNIRKKNTEIVATISHDLRTPLTSVICYLDLLRDGRYPDDVTRQLYINNACTRAYQIKGMSDELFARSVEKVHDETPQWEVLYGNELLSQVLSEMLYTLKEEGFSTDFDYTFREHFNIKTHVVGFRRIFDNLTSNILKYADPAIPVFLTASISANTLHIVQKNTKCFRPVVESTGLGLGTARKLVSQHGGTFQVNDSTTFFEIRLSFPIKLR